MAQEEVKKRALEVFTLLKKEYPTCKIALNFTNPLELLIATILSAQCTDERVNQVSEYLFQKYRAPEDYLRVSQEELEQDIRPTGFYKNKARSLRGCCKLLVERFHSTVPRTMEELTTLPGVARKTANIVLSNAYGVIEGIAVDTHVSRVSQRLGLTKNKDPNKIEQDLCPLLPREHWPLFTNLLIFHGRYICKAKKPLHDQCVLSDICPSVAL